MRKKIFAVSDIHGHYTQMKRALDEVGFIANNEQHLLIVCGDLFDRGNESREVFEYLNIVQNKILIRGNHEDMKGSIDYNDVHNGADKTLLSFFGRDAENFNSDANKDIREMLVDFIEDMYDYYETENYIFTHGWLPTDFGQGVFRVLQDFRSARPMLWRSARSSSWMKMYMQGAMLADKTIVCGHRASQYGCRFDLSRSPDDSSVFFGNGMVAIDALTVRSRRVNVFVTEDSCISAQIHKMNLRKEPFERIAYGKKRVEMRLFDEKRQKLRIGDEILFLKERGGEETLRAKIIGLYRYYHFGVMAWDFDRETLGVPEDAGNVGDYMKNFYSDNDIWNYGSLAIRFRLIK